MFGELSRRNVMALGAGAGIGLGLGPIGASTRAKAAKLRVQAPYWYRFNVGEAEIEKNAFERSSAREKRHA